MLDSFNLSYALKINLLLFKNKSSTSFLRIVGLLFLLIQLGACSSDRSDEVEEDIKNSKAEIEDVVIPLNDNPSFSDNAYVFTGEEYIYITLPDEADAADVQVDFYLSEGAELTIDHQVIEGGVGNLDLSKTIEAEVMAENGNHRNYTILAQPGISDFDLMLYDFKEKYDIPGLSFAIMKMDEGKIVYKTGVGFSDKDKLTRSQSDHLFRLGSISKQFTSIAVMRLIQDKKLAIDDQVFGEGGVLEGHFGKVSDKVKKVTIRHLLDHTAGWVADPDPMFDTQFGGQSLDERIDYVLNSEQPHEPGTEFAYFNMGYAILGKVIQKVSGKNYETYLREVMAEADIDDIWVGGGKLSDRRDNEVVYYPQGGLNAYPQDEEVEAAAGMVTASAEDLLKLLTYIDGKDNPHDILDPDIRDLMLAPSSFDGKYALGWRLNHPLFPGAWYHGGNLAGTATFWVMGEEYSTVLLCNSRSYEDGFDDELYYMSANMIEIAEDLF